jgi:hypothetical protein
MSASDLFTRGGGGTYPKLEELEHKLIMLDCRDAKIEAVPKPQRFGGKPGEMQDRLSADCIVFEDDGSYDVHSDMFFSQVGLINPARKAMKPTSSKPFVLGRVSKVPSSQTKELGMDTPEKVYAGIEEWRDAVSKNKKGVPEPKFAWGLVDFSDEDAAMAMKYINASGPFASADSE